MEDDTTVTLPADPAPTKRAKRDRGMGSELRAMGTIATAMKDLDPITAKRVIRWAAERFTGLKVIEARDGLDPACG